MTKFFNKIQTTVFGQFLVHFPNFRSKKIFPENPALGHTTSYRFLATCQNLENIDDTIPRKHWVDIIFEDPSGYHWGSIIQTPSHFFLTWMIT